MRKRLSNGAFKALARTCLPLMLLLMISCSGDDPADPGNGGGPVQPPPTGDVTQTISATGGAVAATSNEGAIITMTVPAGAVGRPLAFTLSPQTPASGTWLNTIIEPKYMVFFNAIDVSVKAPNGFALDGTHVLFLGDKSSPAFLPTAYNDTLRTLSTTLRGFGASENDPVGFVTRTAAVATNNNLSAASFTCAEHTQLAQQAVDDFVLGGTYDDAVKAMHAVASAVSRSGCSDVDAWVTAVTQAACDSLSGALAAVSTITTYGQLRQNIAPIIYWAAIARVLDPTCSSLADIPATLTSGIGSFVTFFNTELAALVAQDFDGFADLKDEARESHKLFTEALYLGEISASTQLQNDLLFPAVNGLHSRAYALCTGDTWHFPLSRLSSVGFYAERDAAGVIPPNNSSLGESSVYGTFTDADIWQDIQLCATSVDVTTQVTSGGQLDQSSGGGGASPGSHTTEIAVRTPSRGKVTIGGSLAGFTCWEGIKADNELMFILNGTTLRTLNRTTEEYLAAPQELDVYQIAQQANVALLDSTSVTMEVWRNRSACDDLLWGEAMSEVLRIRMDIEGPSGVSIANDLPDTVAAGEFVDLEVQVELTDQLGGKSFEPGVDVRVSAVGATIVPENGQTDANGIFSTQVRVDPDPVAKVDPAAVLLLAIHATADGVIADTVATTTVASCVVDGFLTANNQEELDAFAGVCRVAKTVVLGHDGSGARISNLNALSNLTFAGEGIQIANTDLTDLSGLENVTFGSGQTSISIFDNPNLTNIDALASSSSSEVNRLILVEFRNNPALASIAGFANFVQATGVRTAFLYVQNNAALSSLAGLTPVTVVENDCEISSNGSLADIDGLGSLASVGGLFAISNNVKLCLPLPGWVATVNAGSTDFSGNGTDPSCTP